MEFVASIIGSLAWPITVLVVVWWFRNRILSWFSERPSELKIGPLQLVWATRVAELNTALEESGVTDEELGDESLPERFRALIAVDPNAAVTSAYREMEKALVDVFAAREGASPKRGAALLAREAQSRDWISENTLSAVREISVLRNMVAHGHIDVDRDQATPYVAAVLATATQLKLELESQVS